MNLYASAQLKMTSQPNESEGEFRARLQLAMRERRDLAVDKIRNKYAARIAALQDRVRRAEQAVEREREQASAATMNAVMDVGAGVFGALFGRRRMATAINTAVRRAGRAGRESGDVGRAEENFLAAQQQLDELQTRLQDEIEALTARSDAASEPLGIIAVKPKKTNIEVGLLTLAWAPYRKGANGALEPAWS
jgi:hypothetical protein